MTFVIQLHVQIYRYLFFLCFPSIKILKSASTVFSLSLLILSLQRQMSTEMVVFYPLLFMLANWLALFCTGYCRIWVWDTHLGSQKNKSSHPRASRTYTLVPIMYSCKADFVFYSISPVQEPYCVTISNQPPGEKIKKLKMRGKQSRKPLCYY